MITQYVKIKYFGFSGGKNHLVHLWMNKDYRSYSWNYNPEWHLCGFGLIFLLYYLKFMYENIVHIFFFERPYNREGALKIELLCNCYIYWMFCLILYLNDIKYGINDRFIYIFPENGKLNFVVGFLYFYIFMCESSFCTRK